MLEGFPNDREWAPYRVRNALGVYRRLVNWCDAVGYVCGDFVAGFKSPRARPANEREALSADQCRRLLDAAKGHYLEVPVALALLTGLSRGDLRAITWNEVDLEAGLITRPRSKTGRPLRLQGPADAPEDVGVRVRDATSGAVLQESSQAFGIH